MSVAPDPPKDRAIATGVGSGGGGGVSRRYAQPDYQAAVLPDGGRRVPDLSMVADSVPGMAIRCSVPVACRQAGESAWQAVGGTSYAAPLFAGAILLAAQVGAPAGAPPPGFVNPLVYSEAGRAAFRDVARGSNDIFGLGCCRARPGYDMATGWGSPDVPAFAATALAAWEERPGAAAAPVRGR